MNISRDKKAFLFVIYSSSLIVSHYALSYIFVMSLITIWLLAFILKQKFKKQVKVSVTLTFILLYLVFAVGWYMYVSGSYVHMAAVSIGRHIASSIFTELLNPKSSEGAFIIISETLSPLHDIAKYLHLLTQFFIVVGVLAVLLKRVKTEFKEEFILFSVTYLAIDIAGIVVPYFASSVNTTRLYQMTLIFLSPFCVIGGVVFCRTVCKVLRIYELNTETILGILSVFFAIFLMFNSGFIYEIAGDVPSSISLNNTVDYPRFCSREVSCAKWLQTIKARDITYADAYRWLLIASLNWDEARMLPRKINDIQRNSYIYLGNFNVANNSLLIQYKEGAIRKFTYVDTDIIAKKRNKIYDNCGAQVYR